jgi:hypothetical protein
MGQPIQNWECITLAFPCFAGDVLLNSVLGDGHIQIE